MPSINEWTLARSPNYEANVDKYYPYSEVPYIGQYKLVKIPLNTHYIDHVDYWGEGRINAEEGVSGFRDCYNVNHPSQCVSNGPDKGRKIPNRVAVQSYTTCDTRAYIKDNSVLVVTLMGAPINNSCAKDIARMVDKSKGKVVIYGFNKNAADVKNLESEFKDIGFTLCLDYDLPTSLKGLTLFDSLKNPTNLKEELRNYIRSGNIRDLLKAVTLSKSLAFSSYDYVITNTVNEFLVEGNKNITTFANMLWNDNGEYIVTNHFPEIFKLIMNEGLVKIKSKKHSLELKLGYRLDKDKDRRAYGHGGGPCNERVSWRFIPLWYNNRVIFQLMNVEQGMFLKLSAYQDNIYDREAWGSFVRVGDRHKWYLDPVYSKGELLFFIINVEYGLGLKLAVHEDTDGDRELYGHNSDVHGDPDNFGWYITKWTND